LENLYLGKSPQAGASARTRIRSETEIAVRTVIPVRIRRRGQEMRIVIEAPSSP
jgi:hypothetical protein